MSRLKDDHLGNWTKSRKKCHSEQKSKESMMVVRFQKILQFNFDAFWNSCQFFIQNWIWFFVFFLHKFCDHIYLEVIKLLQCTNLKKILISNTLSHFFSYHEIFFWYTIFGGRHFFLFFLKGKRGLFLVKVHTYRKVKITFVTKEESARKWGTDKKALL